MTYKIVCFYRDDNRRTRSLKTGLTLEEAQAHCRDPNTRGDGWFHGFVQETGRAPRRKAPKK